MTDTLVAQTIAGKELKVICNLARKEGFVAGKAEGRREALEEACKKLQKREGDLATADWDGLTEEAITAYRDAIRIVCALADKEPTE